MSKIHSEKTGCSCKRQRLCNWEQELPIQLNVAPTNICGNNYRRTFSLYVHLQMVLNSYFVPYSWRTVLNVEINCLSKLVLRQNYYQNVKLDCDWIFGSSNVWPNHFIYQLEISPIAIHSKISLVGILQVLVLTRHKVASANIMNLFTNIAYSICS